MKETGMTRRVDELGRVVIPKEIRQIFKIKVGTPLEIFVEGDRLILQKYSLMQGYSSGLSDLADCLCNATGLTVATVNTEEAVIIKGKDAASIAKIELADALYSKISERQPFFCGANEIGGSEDKFAFVFPLISKGDLLGAVALISDAEITLTDRKLTQLACEMFLKQLD